MRSLAALCVALACPPLGGLSRPPGYLTLVRAPGYLTLVQRAGAASDSPLSDPAREFRVCVSCPIRGAYIHTVGSTLPGAKGDRGRDLNLRWGANAHRCERRGRGAHLALVCTLRRPPTTCRLLGALGSAPAGAFIFAGEAPGACCTSQLTSWKNLPAPQDPAPL